MVVIWRDQSRSDDSCTFAEVGGRRKGKENEKKRRVGFNSIAAIYLA